MKDVEKYLQKFQTNNFKAKQALIFIEQLLQQADHQQTSSSLVYGDKSKALVIGCAD